MFLQKFAHQLQRRPFVAPRLNQDVECLTVLVDRPPQIHPTAANRDIHLVQMPLRVCPRTPSSQTSRDRRAKLPYPSPNGLVRHFDTSLLTRLLDAGNADEVPESLCRAKLSGFVEELEYRMWQFAHRMSVWAPTSAKPADAVT